MEEIKFIPFSEKYKSIEENIIFGERPFLGENIDSNISNEDIFFEENLPLWIAYYRLFPHKFVEDFFGIALKDFQIYSMYQIMNKPNNIVLASRGLGKSWLVALCALTKAVLYPAIKIVVASGTKAQSMQTIAKIKEIRTMSRLDLLEFEITEFREGINVELPNVEFQNGSYITVVSSNDNARGHRAHFLILDEYRLIDKNIFESVLHRFLTTPRSPNYLNDPKYAHMIGKERNQEIFMSSAWYKNTWAYLKYITFYNNMKKDGVNSTYNLLSFSYETSIMNGLLSKEQLMEELQEEGFDFSTFAMELKTFWSGEIEDGYFMYNNLLSCRTLDIPYYPQQLELEIGHKDFKRNIVEGEVRIISADIALMGGNKNDNTVISYIVAYPNKSKQYYIREVRYIETISGGVSIDLHSKRIRELYFEYECNYIVLDTNGIGMQVYGDLIRETTYQDTGDIFPPFGCMNDESMQKLVSDQTAQKVIYSIKASMEINKIMNSNLQSRIIRKHVKLLVDEIQADLKLSTNKKYASWIKGTGEFLKILKNPYKQTTLLINEMINLKLVDPINIKLKEPSGGRKDRFSSVAMANYFVTQELEPKLSKKGFAGWGNYKASSRGKNYNRRIS